MILWNNCLFLTFHLTWWPQRPSIAITNGRISFFFMAESYSAVYIPHFLYPFIRWQALTLFPYLGYCEYWCTNIGVKISLRSWFCFLWIYTQKWDCWIITLFLRWNSYHSLQSSSASWNVHHAMSPIPTSTSIYKQTVTFFQKYPWIRSTNLFLNQEAPLELSSFTDPKTTYPLKKKNIKCLWWARHCFISVNWKYMVLDLMQLNFY